MNKRDKVNMSLGENEFTKQIKLASKKAYELCRSWLGGVRC